MNRRDLIKSAAATGAGWIILPSGSLHAAPSNKLNVALIGAWGRGTAHYKTLLNENVVALCDVDDRRLAEALKTFPRATPYTDWRQALDQKGLDAVVICTADHHHAFVANWAINRELHVFCEKPLGITVEEARTVRANYLKHRGKIATQHGTQRHAFPNFQRVRELILDGAVGQLKSVSAWDSRQNPRPGYPPAEGEPPAYLHYEQWIGPSRFHPYNPLYFSATQPGANCMKWNPYLDFGIGQMGDMGSHTMDLVWNVIDGGAPVSIYAEGDAYGPDICPVQLKVTYQQPANQWRPPIEVIWYQGGLKPAPPKSYIDVTKMGNGAIFEGTKGWLLADFNSRILIPSDNDGDLLYYKRRGQGEMLPLMGGTGARDGRDLDRLFQQEWIEACKDRRKKTSCDFDYAGTMMEQMILGLVAHRAARKLEYDPASGRVTNVPEANEYLSRKHRPGWTLNG